jgi:hypothetical protein
MNNINSKNIVINKRKCIIHYEKCYNTKSQIKVALNMIVKNEKDNIEKTLISVLDFCDLFVILDTGSEDDTISTVINFCEKHKKSLYLISYPFENFSITRNIAIEYAEDKADFLLFMDSNDELKEPNTKLKSLSKNYVKEFHSFLEKINKDENVLGLYLKQEWYSGGQIDRYHNIRLVKTKKQWRYKAPVHEYISCPDVEKDGTFAHVVKIENGPCIYQDRTKDAHKSIKRFTRDKELLYKEYLNNPHDSRTLFYLAQTCSCLKQFEESYKYYLLRTKEKGFLEEVFHAYLRAAELAKVCLNYSEEEVLDLYLKSLEFSCSIFNCPRAEPLVKLAEIYLKKDNKLMAHTFLKISCQSIQPTDCSLFVDGHIYDYTRWHMIGITGYYVNDFNLGLIGSIIAYINEKKEIDKNNIKTYIDESKYNHEKLIEFLNTKTISDIVNLFILKKKEKNIQNYFLIQNVEPFLEKFKK